jgi:hypothetical protein
MSYTITYLNKPFAQRTALSVLHVTATSAESAYVDVSNLIRIGAINLGVQIQGFGAAIVPSLTLADPDFASLIANDAKVPWHVLASQASGVLTCQFFCPTVVRLAFAGAGSAFLTVF